MVDPVVARRRIRHSTIGLGLLLLALVMVALLFIRPWSRMASDGDATAMVSAATVTPVADRLQLVLERGVLRVATRNGPSAYFIGPDGPQGFEYELAAAFAQWLDVRLQIIAVERYEELLPMVAAGEADLAAAGLTPTLARQRLVQFGPAYDEVQQLVIFRAGSTRPRSVSDLIDRQIAVVGGSSYADRLLTLQGGYPQLFWNETDEDLETLLQQIDAGTLDITIADSSLFALHRRFFPRIRRGFELSDPEPLAWAFQHEDETLIEAAGAFFEDIDSEGRLTELKRRHFAYVREYNQVDSQYLMRHIDQRLPDVEPYLRQAADDYAFDWRLLAAVAYQESHWNPNAVSPTGVRGVMMLTNATADYLGIDDRLDPAQSIDGGARYLRILVDRVPERIPFPDRLWMALAAYNMGYGHLEDARVLTQRRGGDPDSWVDVSDALPLLTQREWFSQTRYGYARGREAQRYVRLIRSYYDVLRWYFDREQIVRLAEHEAPLA